MNNSLLPHMKSEIDAEDFVTSRRLQYVNSNSVASLDNSISDKNDPGRNGGFFKDIRQDMEPPYNKICNNCQAVINKMPSMKKNILEMFQPGFLSIASNGIVCPLCMFLKGKCISVGYSESDHRMKTAFSYSSDTFHATFPFLARYAKLCILPLSD